MEKEIRRRGVWRALDRRSPLEGERVKLRGKGRKREAGTWVRDGEIGGVNVGGTESVGGESEIERENRKRKRQRDTERHRERERER